MDLALLALSKCLVCDCALFDHRVGCSWDRVGDYVGWGVGGRQRLGRVWQRVGVCVAAGSFIVTFSM